MARRYAILDVFTRTPLAGNALAVIYDGEGLDTAQMQAIAREANLSETVFVLPPAEPAQRARLRIFTPAAELPFAGHPTVGTAVALALQDGAGDRRFVLGEEIGPVDCEVRIEGEHTGWARFRLPKLPYDAGAAAPVEKLAAALGLQPEEIGFPGHRPSRWGVGAPFTMVPLRDRDALARAAVVPGAWPEAFGTDKHNAAFLYVRGGTEGGDFRTRMYAPGMGIGEDPATGSAVASFAGLVMQTERPADGEHAFLIEQGFEMGRPSLIELGLSVAGGRLAAATIAGGAVRIADGILYA
jgi:trans-2,3-dihydro-3-hydroxyanthranilate isomerase